MARLRSQQERASDEQAERDALRAKRATEEAEREWRRKEAAEARHKKEVEDMLRAARSQQMQQKEHYLAVEAQRERAEFEKVSVSVPILVSALTNIIMCDKLLMSVGNVCFKTSVSSVQLIAKKLL